MLANLICSFQQKIYITIQVFYNFQLLKTKQPGINRELRKHSRWIANITVVTAIVRCHYF